AAVTAYIVRRLLYLIPLILGVALIVSVVYSSGLFGDAASKMLSKHAKAEDVAALRHALHLDLPWYQQYWDFLGDICRLDFGRSSQYHVKVSEMIARGAGPSLMITLPAFAIATVIAVSFSLLCASFRGKAIDRSILVVAVGLMSVSSLVYVIFGQ